MFWESLSRHDNQTQLVGKSCRDGCLGALKEDLSSDPSTHTGQFITTRNSSSLLASWNTFTHRAHTCIDINVKSKQRKQSELTDTLFIFWNCSSSEVTSTVFSETFIISYGILHLFRESSQVEYIGRSTGTKDLGSNPDTLIPKHPLCLKVLIYINTFCRGKLKVKS